MEEHHIRHLELIQGVVSRLAGNSFSLKSWTVGIVSILVLLAAKDSNEAYAVIAVFPALCFWGLDAYYLRQERLFRELYTAVLKQAATPGQPETIPLFSLDTSPVAARVEPWFSTLRSPTVSGLHGPVVAAVAAVTAYAILGH